MNPEMRTHVGAYFMSYLRELSTREVLTAAADILIVAYVIYRVLKLIRGTRAMQMLVGMLLVAALFAAARRFELTTVSWLFENLINYFIIFLIVIFQHDIRRGLMQVGQNLWRRQQYEETYVIEEVVQAADEMSRRRIGGLIVLERDADLSEHLGEVGIPLDAKVTKELLVTLFIPDADNHMHDGAVIIKNLRVEQAGAVLPLSANPKLDKQLGTRHRAAIGVTEETDAVVVVVSEERGTVSLCFNGNIARDLTPATLRKALLGLLQKKNKTKGKSPGRLVRQAEPASRSATASSEPPAAGAEVGGGLAPHMQRGAAPTSRPHAVEPSAGERLSAELMSLVVTQPLQRPVEPTAAEAETPSSGSLRSAPGLAALQVATPPAPGGALDPRPTPAERSEPLVRPAGVAAPPAE
ncbi:MAG: diadenylate cyclase CdaA [Myxococcales bacterium]|nr:diadenylate cyclase CdaA [Myxococcota bacterium]MDW8283023.1 diadenylate cyclase CdaA [Myxococcales bacterium]